MCRRRAATGEETTTSQASICWCGCCPASAFPSIIFGPISVKKSRHYAAAKRSQKFSDVESAESRMFGGLRHALYIKGRVLCALGGQQEAAALDCHLPVRRAFLQRAAGFSAAGYSGGPQNKSAPAGCRGTEALPAVLPAARCWSRFVQGAPPTLALDIPYACERWSVVHATGLNCCKYVIRCQGCLDC